MKKDSYTIVIKWKINKTIKLQKIEGSLESLRYELCMVEVRNFLAAKGLDKGTEFFLLREKDSSKHIGSR